MDKKRAQSIKTVKLMVELYCNKHHKLLDSPCSECETLIEYASERLIACSFGSEKPPCTLCPIHCYKQDMRSKIKSVMGFSGPRLIWTHPLLSIEHIFQIVSFKIAKK